MILHMPLEVAATAGITMLSVHVSLDPAEMDFLYLMNATSRLHVLDFVRACRTISCTILTVMFLTVRLLLFVITATNPIRSPGT